MLVAWGITCSIIERSFVSQKSNFSWVLRSASSGAVVWNVGMGYCMLTSHDQRLRGDPVIPWYDRHVKTDTVVMVKQTTCWSRSTLLIRGVCLTCSSSSIPGLPCGCSSHPLRADDFLLLCSQCFQKGDQRGCNISRRLLPSFYNDQDINV